MFPASLSTAEARPRRSSSSTFLPLLLLVLLSLLVTLTTAAPTPSLPYFAQNARRTPPAVLPPPTSYLPLNDRRIAGLLPAMRAAAGPDLVKRDVPLDQVINVDLLQRRADPPLLGGDCLNSTATDVEINSLFYYGGAGTVVLLCPGAKIKLQDAVFFTAENQVLATKGLPADPTRATLTITSATQSCAIFGACPSCSGCQLRSVQIAGQRNVLGRIPDGIALIEMGGSNSGQVIREVKAWEPRGWSVLHAIEGYQNSCEGMLIERNEIGPAGWAPTGSQFRKRDDVAPGQWADGISHACRNSRVRYNTITDTTDGGIVVFGATGSIISYNVIIAKTRQALGGINMVDWNPYAGSFVGTVVEHNTLNSLSSMIKIGIAIGGMSWGSDNRTVARTFGGIVRNNHFQSGPTDAGFFGFAIALAGHEGAMVTGNRASQASFGGLPTRFCIPNVLPPSPRAFVYDQWTTPGRTVQAEFWNAPLVFLICTQPGPIVQHGVPLPPKVTTTTTTTSTTTTSKPPPKTTTTTTKAPTTTTTSKRSIRPPRTISSEWARVTTTAKGGSA